MKTRTSLINFAALLFNLQLKGNISLPAIFSDHMVLQQDILGLRYAYTNDSDPNLFKSAGLPASCFEISPPEDER